MEKYFKSICIFLFINCTSKGICITSKVATWDLAALILSVPQHKPGEELHLPHLQILAKQQAQREEELSQSGAIIGSYFF